MSNAMNSSAVPVDASNTSRNVVPTSSRAASTLALDQPHPTAPSLVVSLTTRSRSCPPWTPFRALRPTTRGLSPTNVAASTFAMRLSAGSSMAAVLGLRGKGAACKQRRFQGVAWRHPPRVQRITVLWRDIHAVARREVVPACRGEPRRNRRFPRASDLPRRKPGCARAPTRRPQTQERGYDQTKTSSISGS